MADILRLRSRFLELFGPGECRLFQAPGRVNLIGEHTDYNEGFVLPMAVERHVLVALRPRPDERVRLASDRYSAQFQADLSGPLEPGTPVWARYILGVARLLQADARQVRGFDALIDGDLPPGAGLSSSAALTVATARALATTFSLELPATHLAEVCQRAEWEYIGVRCGIMDQMVSLLGQRGSALFIDCRDLATATVPVPEQVATVMVCDTGKRRELSASAYNARRQECAQAVAMLTRLGWSGRSLRDLTVHELDSYRSSLPEPLGKRARHVVEENNRVLKARDSLERGDVAAFGALLLASHRSLRDLYEVTGPELDAIVEEAMSNPHCLGARMTGAGFGGCAIALVSSGHEEEFARAVEEAYARRTGFPAQVYAVRSADGASEVL